MKSNVRNNILQELKLLSDSEKNRQSLLIQSNLKKLFLDKKGAWLAFKNLKDEPHLNWSEISEQVQWSFPKLNEENLEFYKDVTDFKRSALGFAEPANGIPVQLSELNGVVLPGVAFDKNGYRLGRGKGYYDRALSNFSGPKIGVCFESSFCEEIPTETHDIQCDQIITSSRIYKVNKSEGVEKWN